MAVKIWTGWWSHNRWMMGHDHVDGEWFWINIQPDSKDKCIILSSSICGKQTNQIRAPDKVFFLTFT